MTSQKTPHRQTMAQAATFFKKKNCRNNRISPLACLLVLLRCFLQRDGITTANCSLSLRKVSILVHRKFLSGKFPVTHHAPALLLSVPYDGRTGTWLMTCTGFQSSYNTSVYSECVFLVRAACTRPVRVCERAGMDASVYVCLVQWT